MLYFLIDYSERAFRVLHRPLTTAEQRDLYEVFRRIGEELEIQDLPLDYEAWRVDRELHLARDLTVSRYTRALYTAYRRQLGPWRYLLLLEVQGALVPDIVRDLLHLPRWPVIEWVLPVYPVLARLQLRDLIRRVLVPGEYLDDVRSLDRVGAAGA